MHDRSGDAGFGQAGPRSIAATDQAPADKGRQALADYARTPFTVTPLRSEPLLRLLICDLVDEEVTRESLGTLRDDIADLRRRLDDSEHSAADLPHREKYLVLVIDFLRGLLDLHEQLVERVEREWTAAR